MTDLAASLDEHLADVYDFPEEEEARVGFRIDDDGRAIGALRALGKVQARMADVRRIADEQREIIADWETSQLEGLAGDERFFEGALGDYWRRQLKVELDELLDRGLSFDEAWDKVRTKSRKLPTGTLSATKGRTSIVIDDKDAVVAWALEHDRLAILTHTPSKEALSGLGRSGAILVTEDGEPIPGVRAETAGVSYKAKPA